MTADPISARILVMDDETALRSLTREILRREGYEVTEVANGEDAIERCRQALAAEAPYHLLIMDLYVANGMGGLEAIRRIRAFAPSIRAIASSGSIEKESLSPNDGLFDAFLAKPYQIHELVNAVKVNLAG